MKILLYTEGLKAIRKSGLGKAIEHQKKSLEDNKVDYTTNLKDDYDLLHINFYGPKSYLYAKKARKKGKKIVYHAHSTEEDFRNSFLFSNLVAPLFKKWLIKCYTLGDYIITPTEYSKRLLLNYDMNRPIKAISNGVDTKFFERNAKAGEEFRKTYGYTKKDKVIVGIGLYIKRKGILDFVELAKRLPEYKFIWFGHSPLAASPKEIRKAVNTKLPNLTFAGYVEQPMIKAALSGADLYLFPTLEETEGIPIIEALTSKIPTLIRDIPVFEEYPEDKVVYKAKDIDDFEKKIKLILSGKLPNITEEGYKMAKKKDVKIVGKELINTYKEVLKMERVEEENKHRISAILLILLAIALIVLLQFNNNKEYRSKSDLEPYETSFEAMNSKINVKVYAYNEKDGKEALDQIKNIYVNIDKLTSRENTLKIIKNNNKELNIDSELYDILTIAEEWKKDSNGYFDIAIGNAYDLWDKYRESKGVPSNDEISKLDNNTIKLLGKNKIETNNANLYLDNIKKGYANAKVKEYLASKKIDAYIISSGGNLMVGDYYMDEGNYMIPIESPFIEEDVHPLTTLYLKNKAISIRGLYQNSYEVDGKVYSNVINPKTNKPSYNVVSTVVICDDSIDADVISTALFNMSVPDGQKYMEKHDSCAAIWAYYAESGENKKIFTENFWSLNER